MGKKVCVVTGVGEGNGRAISARFARDGYAVAMLARSAERLRKLEAEIDGAKGYPCDVSDEAAVEATVEAIHRDLGPIDTLVHNAGSGMFADFHDTSPEQLRTAFEVNALSLLLLGQPATRDMLEAGAGNVVVVGATASLRGGANFAPFAAAKAAQRSLAQSMARSLGPRGVHVSYLIIDGVVDTPRTRAADWAKDKPDDFFLQPDHIADTIHYLTQQPRSAWTFELDVRPFGEPW
jgi:NAD(P)-dependent dehydrogenase (short-subunit alcohol dehydrogenase family)